MTTCYTYSKSIVLFEWDKDKNRRNLEKHGITLGRAAEMFDSPTDQRIDRRHDYGEKRIICYGLIAE